MTDDSNNVIPFTPHAQLRPDVETNLYPKLALGFTQTPEIRSILDPYEAAAGMQTGGLVMFHRLPVSGLARILELIPELADDHHNSAPSLGEIVVIGKTNDVAVSGYRVVPDRADERISVDQIVVETVGRDLAVPGFVVPLAMSADSYWYTEDQCIHLWWD